MFYIDENLLDDGRALITVNVTKDEISKILKAGMINYTSADRKLWLTNEDIRENIDNPLVSDMFDRIITARNGIQIEDSFQFLDDQFFMKNVTIKKDLLVEGNFKVLGNSTVIDTPHMSIEDNIIELNRNETGNGVTLEKAGTAINRGDLGFARIVFDETTKSFILDKAATIDGARTYYPIQIFLEDSGNYKAGDTKITHKLYSPYIDVNNVLNVKDIANIKNLNVSTATTLNGTLTVNAPATFNNTLRVKGVSTLDGNLITNGTITANNTALFKRPVTMEQTLNVKGITTLDNTLNVSTGGINLLAGNAVFHDDLEVKDNARILKNLNVTGAGSIEGALTVNSRATIEDILSRTNMSLASGNGNGLRFWDSNDYKIYMNQTVEKMTGAANSDYNMYLKMTGGTNRGFVFLNGATPIMQLEGNGKLRVKDDMYSKNSLVLTQAMEGSGNGIDADMVDGKHAVDLVLRDGTQEMLGNFNMATHKIIWNENNELVFTESGSVLGANRAGLFKFTAGGNTAQTVLESGLFKAGNVYIEGTSKSLNNITLIKSEDGKIIETKTTEISINGDNYYELIHFNNSIIRADGGVLVGVDGNTFIADESQFKYKGENVLTTAGTKFMNGDINMHEKKLKFNSSITGSASDNKTAEIYATHEGATELNIVVGSNDTDKILLKKKKADGTLKTLVDVQGEKVVFTDLPYHNTDKLLTSADIGPGNGLDADTVDGKHYDDLVQDFVNADGDTMNGDLFFSGNTKAKFGNETSYINKDVDLNIVSEENVVITAGAFEVKANKEGTLTLDGDRVLTVADEGEGNLLDSDTVDGIHAEQFVRRDEMSIMEADINFDGNKAIFDGGEVYGTATDVVIEKTEGQAVTRALIKSNKAFEVEISEDGLNFESLVKADETELSYKGQGVWHEGSFTPELYEKIEPIVLEDLVDLDTIVTTGKYLCKVLTGVNSSVNGKAGVVEVIKESDLNILQRVSSMCGTYIVQRALCEGAWKDWVIVAGKQNFSKEITLDNWLEELEMYYVDVTHNLTYKGIASVTLVDSEGFSMFTGFKELNSSIIRVYSASRIAGKIAINTVLN